MIDTSFIPFHLLITKMPFSVRLFVVLAVWACSLATVASAQTTDPPTIRCFVSILPQQFFVSRVGGSHVSVSVLVGPGQEPHTFELMPKAMTSLSRADLFFALGLPFEKVIIRKLTGASHQVRIVDTTQGVPFIASQEEHDEAQHQHNEQQGLADPDRHPSSGRTRHNHKGPTGNSRDDIKQGATQRDPHIWLDPNLVKIQAAQIAQALMETDPSHSDDFKSNLKKFHQELDELDAELAKALAPYKGQKFYVYHPAFGYFAARYGLVQIPVEIGGKEPTAKHIAELIASAKKDRVSIIFVQPQFSRKSAEILAKAINGSVIPIDALSGDYLNNMKGIAKTMEEAMQGAANARHK